MLTTIKSWLTSGVLVGILAFIGTIATLLGKPTLGAFFSDPTTATTLSTVLNGVLALVAGVLGGIKETS